MIELQGVEERLKKTWRKVIEHDMSFLGIEENMALDRTEWRERICIDDFS